MAESVFKSRKLPEIYDEIRGVYLADNRPWILGFSGGKDSTCMVQLIWNALAGLEPSKVRKKIFIISSDTLVESPKIVEQITNTLDMMEQAAREKSLPIHTNLVRPKIEDSFWVCLLGKGFPAPSNMFRWCTDRLKIRNADRFIKERVSEYGEAIVVLGTRKDESGSRQQLMNLYEIKGSLLSRHSKFPQTYVYTPVRDFTATDVWNYLLQNPNPMGGKQQGPAGALPERKGLGVPAGSRLQHAVVREQQVRVLDVHCGGQGHVPEEHHREWRGVDAAAAGAAAGAQGHAGSGEEKAGQDSQAQGREDEANRRDAAKVVPGEY